MKRIPIEPHLRARLLTLLQTLALTFILIATIALADWLVDDKVPLGWLYLLPLGLAGRKLSRTGLIALAAGCTLLAEDFDGFAWDLISGLPRVVLYFSAFAGIGLFVHQVVTSRRLAAVHLETLEREIKARTEAEEQLEVLILSSPVAVFTADANGTVLLANDAADRLFALEPGALPGKSVSKFLPPLLNVPGLRGGRTSIRTAMQCRGRRDNGEIFQADVWFSTYATSTGPRLAALAVDTSDDLRDREESSLHQLLAGSRILVGAVSHEIRNVCGAIAVVHENLARSGTLSQNKDFEALGTLVVALERIAAMELGQAANELDWIDLDALLEEVLIIIAPALREEEIALCWKVTPGLPRVWADRQSLMQVFLNLVKNSQHAMEESPSRSLTIDAAEQPGHVLIRVRDTGCGVTYPELLFKPFQQQARSTGLGLYLSRALMRSFSGELRYDPDASRDGACFVVELAPHVEAAT